MPSSLCCKDFRTFSWSCVFTFASLQKNAHLKVICIRQAGVEKLREKDQMLTRRLEELCGWMQFFARDLIPSKLSSFPSLVSSPKRNLISSCHIDSYLYSFSGEGRQPALQETRILSVALLLFQTFSQQCSTRFNFLSFLSTRVSENLMFKVFAAECFQLCLAWADRSKSAN